MGTPEFNEKVEESTVEGRDAATFATVLAVVSARHFASWAGVWKSGIGTRNVFSTVVAWSAEVAAMKAARRATGRPLGI